MQIARTKLSRFCSLQDALIAPEYRRHRRIHGLQLPLHPQQIIGWVAILGVAASTYCVLIPLLDLEVQSILYGALSAVLLVHVVSHLVILLLDPAELAVRLQPSTAVVPEFDRRKHRHVIENGRCHLCNITTQNKRTKHCSICNKCVSRFDHHCKWLNTCIGNRNYGVFIVCLSSTVLTSLMVLCISIAELSLMNLNHGNLSVWNVTLDNITLPMLPFPGTGSLIVISVIGVVSAIAAILLIHLCFFHGYIACLGISTYEYVLRKRLKNQSKRNGHTVCPRNFCNDANTVPPVRYHFCENVGSPPSNVNGQESRNVYICSTHSQETIGSGGGGSGSSSTGAKPSVKERRNFHLYFSYETQSNEASIELSSETIVNHPVPSIQEASLELKPSTPSPVSCCFSMINHSSSLAERQAKHKKRQSLEGVDNEKGRSCTTMRRIQTFLRNRLRKNARQRSLNADACRARKNKVTPATSPEGAEKGIESSLRRVAIEETTTTTSTPMTMPMTMPMQLRPENKLPPLTLPSEHRVKQIVPLARTPSQSSFAVSAATKRSHQPPHLRVRRPPMHKRPRFKMGSHVTQSAQLSPIPESELSKPASPRSPPQLHHFAFPPLHN